MKTLFVSDLDGTLLNQKEEVSDYTIKTMNRLIKEHGMNFTYATARSCNTASVVTKGLELHLPRIVYNGVLIVKDTLQEYMFKKTFLPDEVADIRWRLQDAGVHPIVYSFIDGIERFCYVYEDLTSGAKDYMDSRKGDAREYPLFDHQNLYAGEVFYFTCIAQADCLATVYNAIKDRYSCVFHEDIYTQDSWLEIMPKGISKASGIEELKKQYGFDYIVAFGDSKNDLPMFELADECYAMRNANPLVKEKATAIIDENFNDGVARWLYDNIDRFTGK